MTFYNKDGWYNNIFGDGVNVFGAGPTSTQRDLATPVSQGGFGLLKPEELEKAQKASLTKGLLGTVVSYLAQPKNQGYGSAIPYLAKAYHYGINQAQEPFNRLETGVQKAQQYKNVTQHNELVQQLMQDPRVQQDPILKSAVMKDPMGVYNILNDQSQQTPYNIQELQSEVAYLQSLPENKGKTLTELTNQAFRNIQERKRANTSVTVEAPPLETAYDKKMGEFLADDDFNFIKGARQAPMSIDKMDDTLRIIRNPKTSVGKFTTQVTALKATAQKFLNVDQSIKDEVSNTQLLDALLGSEVFPMIKALGIGARGLDTPAEREFLRQVMTGTIELNRDTLTKMTMIRRKTFAKAVTEYNRRLKNGHYDRLKRFAGDSVNEIHMATGANSAFIADATEDSTGREVKIYADGSAWYVDEEGNVTDEAVPDFNYLEYNYDF